MIVFINALAFLCQSQETKPFFHILYFVFFNYYRKFPDLTEPLQDLYIDTKRSFSKLDKFIHESVQRYVITKQNITNQIYIVEFNVIKYNKVLSFLIVFLSTISLKLETIHNE